MNYYPLIVMDRMYILGGPHVGLGPHVWYR